MERLVPQITNFGNTNGGGPFGTSLATNAGSILFAGTGGTLRFTATNQFDYSSRFSTAANQMMTFDTAGTNVGFGTPITSAGGSVTRLWIV